MKNKNKHRIGQESGIEVKIKDGFLETEGTPEEVVEWLQQNVNQSGQYWIRNFLKKDFPRINSYIESLRRAGLEIGKGNAQYGYRLPLPTPYSPFRELQIFRRKNE